MDVWLDIIERLGVAAVAGAVIGLNRDLNRKPIGMRTLAIVSLASAMTTYLAIPGDSFEGISDSASRVIQGLLTGIGFLGAGVILRSESRGEIHGLTSAACTWLTACVGVVCGAGQWRIVLVGLSLAFLFLVFGSMVERGLRRVLDRNGIDREGED